MVNPTRSSHLFLLVALLSAEPWSVESWAGSSSSNWKNNVHSPNDSGTAAASKPLSRRSAVASIVGTAALLTGSPAATNAAQEFYDPSTAPVEVFATNADAKKLFNEGRALEQQGNMAAAQRLYDRVTKISPRFIYGKHVIVFLIPSNLDHCL